MKRIMLVVAMVLAMASVSMAADLALRANWTANTDSVTTGYRLYRTDTTRTLVATIPGRAIATYNFTLTVPDNSTGTLRFVMTAYSATKESADSVAATFPFDLTPVPSVPGGFGIVSQ